MAKRKTLKQQHTLRMFLPGLKEPVAFQVPMSDAIKPVTMDRKDIDAFNGRPGYAVECMNAQCGLRNKNVFPHPVYLAEFTDTRAYFVDRISKAGQPLHCIRYYHHDGDEQKEFDRPGGKQRLIRSGKVNRALTLLAPTAGTKHTKSTSTRAAGDHSGPRVKGPRKASFARAMRAGLYGA